MKAISLLRMQLIPYLYTAFADYTFKGTVRAMNLEEGYNMDENVVSFDATNNPYALAIKKK